MEKEEFVGLREQPEDAWTTRVLPKEADALPQDFLMDMVIFTARGFMKFATENSCNGTPRFQRAIYKDGEEWGAWRFYGGTTQGHRPCHWGELGSHGNRRRLGVLCAEVTVGYDACELILQLCLTVTARPSLCGDGFPKGSILHIASTKMLNTVKHK